MFILEKELKNYKPFDQKENENLELVKNFLKNETNCFSRTNLKGHITGSALVIDKEKNILLNHHKFLDISNVLNLSLGASVPGSNSSHLDKLAELTNITCIYHIYYSPFLFRLIFILLIILSNPQKSMLCKFKFQFFLIKFET